MTAKEYYELFKLRHKQAEELLAIQNSERQKFLETPPSIELRDSTLEFIKKYDAKEDRYKAGIDGMKFHILNALLKSYWETTIPDVVQVHKNLDTLGSYMMNISPSLHDFNHCYITNSMYFMLPLYMCLYSKAHDYTINYIAERYTFSSPYMCSFVSMLLYVLFGVDRQLLESFLQYAEFDQYDTHNKHMDTMNILCNRYYYFYMDQVRSKMDLSDIKSYITYLDFAERTMPHLPDSDNKFCDEIKKQFLETLKDPCL